MQRFFAALLLLTAVLLTACSGPPVTHGGVAASSVPKTGNALFVVHSEEDLRGGRIIGPEEESTHGLVLGFETPWEYVSPGTYRVPAGTVVFHLHRGPLTKRGAYQFGFQAKPGETYDLRLEEIGTQPVTILERGTGRIATTRGIPKRYPN